MPVRLIRIAATLLLMSLGTVVQAQPRSDLPPPRIARGDLWGSLGWFNADKGQETGGRASYSNDWYNRSLWGGAGASYYWTDHWKTEVEVGGHTEGLVRGQRPLATPVPEVGYLPFIYMEHRYLDRTVSIGQSYQFLRNAWAHPFVGAGVNLDWERHSFVTPRQTVYTRPPDNREIVLINGSSGREGRFKPKAFVIGGVKAYFTERGYFRTDLKLAGVNGVEQVVVRFGLGFDW
ncbi:MAG: hypothetical protein HY654_09205 [Acidobacteria bacterium]|nr:hypothetical protein [Acidobacteriota bacterium]